MLGNRVGREVVKRPVREEAEVKPRGRRAASRLDAGYPPSGVGLL